MRAPRPLANLCLYRCRVWEYSYDEGCHDDRTARIFRAPAKPAPSAVANCHPTRRPCGRPQPHAAAARGHRGRARHWRDELQHECDGPSRHGRARRHRGHHGLRCEPGGPARGRRRGGVRRAWSADGRAGLRRPDLCRRRDQDVRLHLGGAANGVRRGVLGANRGLLSRLAQGVHLERHGGPVRRLNHGQYDRWRVSGAPIDPTSAQEAP